MNGNEAEMADESSNNTESGGDTQQGSERQQETETDSNTRQGNDNTDNSSTSEESALPEGVRKALNAARKEARDAEKARKALETQVNEFKQRDMTATQRLEAERDENKTRAEKAEASLLRHNVAAKAGLDVKLIPRLQGSTEAELLADAEELKKFQTPTAPDFDGGTRTTADAPKSMSDFIRAAARK